MSETNRLTDEFEDLEELFVEPALPTTSIKNRLVAAVRESTSLSQKIQELSATLQQAQQLLLKAEGKQDALWPVFLDGTSMTPQQAYDSNHKGIQDALGPNPGARKP